MIKKSLHLLPFNIATAEQLYHFDIIEGCWKMSAFETYCSKSKLYKKNLQEISEICLIRGPL